VLEDLEREYERLEDAQERAFGADKIDKINE
jgi:hypothetical protein